MKNANAVSKDALALEVPDSYVVKNEEGRRNGM
jgi:hypothetical protein